MQDDTMTFEKRHYEYLADTILNDPDILYSNRVAIHHHLQMWFKRDFPN
ncbi:hypothetical protein LCGC14_2341670, partial [marine sediment metagenome]